VRRHPAAERRLPQREAERHADPGQRLERPIASVLPAPAMSAGWQAAPRKAAAHTRIGRFGCARSPSAEPMIEPIAKAVTIAAQLEAPDSSRSATISNVAASACVAARTRSEASITRWRDTRSPTTPPTSASAASGIPCAASTSPRLDAEPDSSSTANASATGNSASPTIEIALPLNSSAKSRLRRAAALRRW
jgi:hypothetical protein